MVRRFGKLVLASAAVALLTVPAQAQQRGFGGGMGGMGGGPSLLTNKSVQEELKLDASQVEKVTKIANEQMEKVRGQFQGLQDLSPEQRREKMQSSQQETRRATNQALREGDVLKPEQFTRFMEIELQQLGVAALSSPFVAERLNLTEEQKGKIKAVVDEQPNQMRGAFQGGGGGDREAAMQRLRDLRKEAMDKASAVLTAEQKDSFQKMLGSPFEVKFEARQGQGGQGRGQGGQGRGQGQ